MPNIATYTIVDVEAQSHFEGEFRAVSATGDVKGGTLFRCDATAGAVVLDLPDAEDFSSRILHFKKIDSANTVTIQGIGGQTIDGAADFDLTTQWDSVTIISDGENWLII